MGLERSLLTPDMKKVVWKRSNDFFLRTLELRKVSDYPLCLLDCNTHRKVNAIAVPEQGFKSRVVTVGNFSDMTLMHIVRTWGFGILRKLGLNSALSGQGDGQGGKFVTAINKSFGKLSVAEKGKARSREFFSLDMSRATDTISRELIAAFIKGFRRSTKVPGFIKF